MSDLPTSTPTMVERVDAALHALPRAARDSAPARRALMLAESVDDDEGDGLFRFGPRLRTALQSLGPTTLARVLPLHRPGSARLVLAEPSPLRQPHPSWDLAA